MKRYAIIENGKVVNVTVGPDDWDVPDGITAVESDLAEKGWSWDGSAFTPASEPEVLQNLTMRQFRLGLRRSGLLSAVEAALAAMPGPEGEDARIEFEYASEVERGNALVSGLAAALGLTDEQINALWKASIGL